MASLKSHNGEIEPPHKRQKLAPSPHPPSIDTIITQDKPAAKMDNRATKMIAATDTGFQPEREFEVGVMHFVNASNPGFSGTLKQR